MADITRVRMEIQFICHSFQLKISRLVYAGGEKKIKKIKITLFCPWQIVDICEASALRLDGHLFQV